MQHSVGLFDPTLMSEILLVTANDWREYELVDAGDGERLERWGNILLQRPDPKAIWPCTRDADVWTRADAVYHRSSRGGGRWEFRKQVPSQWNLVYGELAFIVRLTGFKHTGVFPEQAPHWDWIGREIGRAGRPVRVLHLFAYTGAATIAAANAGAAEVCHVDAAKGVVSWAKDNLKASGLADRNVRFIVDDVVKFVRREQRRGRRYHAIIMDPPVYGRGPHGEIWRIEQSLARLLDLCIGLLDPDPLFFLITCYASGLSPLALKNLIQRSGAFNGGTAVVGELGIPLSGSSLVLPSAVFARLQWR